MNTPKLLTPWIPDSLLIIAGVLLIVSPFMAIIFSLVLISIILGFAPAAAFASTVPFALASFTLSLPLLLYASSGFIIEKISLVSEYSELKQLKTAVESKRANALLTNTYSTFFRQSDGSSDTNDSQLSSGHINQAFYV